MKTSPQIWTASGKALVWATGGDDGWTYVVHFADDRPDLLGLVVHPTQRAAIEEGCADAKQEVRDRRRN